MNLLSCTGEVLCKAKINRSIVRNLKWLSNEMVVILSYLNRSAISRITS